MSNRDLLVEFDNTTARLRERIQENVAEETAVRNLIQGMQQCCKTSAQGPDPEVASKPEPTADASQTKRTRRK